MLILCECTHEAFIKWILLISVDIFLFPAIEYFNEMFNNELPLKV